MKPLLCENNLTKRLCMVFYWRILVFYCYLLLESKFGVNGVLMFVCVGGAL
jgi:hypothetical protein